MQFSVSVFIAQSPVLARYVWLSSDLLVQYILIPHKYWCWVWNVQYLLNEQKQIEVITLKIFVMKGKIIITLKQDFHIEKHPLQTFFFLSLLLSTLLLLGSSNFKFLFSIFSVIFLHINKLNNHIMCHYFRILWLTNSYFYKLLITD